jgi:hypothetical protein
VYIDVYEEPSYGYDDWRQDQLAAEGAREHDARQREHIAGDEDPDADIPF